MAVVNLTGTNMTNVVATPPVKVESKDQGGRVRVAREVITLTSGDSILSTYHFARLPKEAKLLRITGDADGTATCATGMDVGELVPNASGADALLGESIGLTTALKGINLMHKITGTSADVSDGLVELWEILGYASREAAPALIDLAISLDAAIATGNSDMLITTEYVTD